MEFITLGRQIKFKGKGNYDAAIRNQYLEEEPKLHKGMKEK